MPRSNENRLSDSPDQDPQYEEKLHDIIEKLHGSRQDVERIVTQMQQSAIELKSFTRRDENYGLYLNFANAYLRLAGALNQGTRRTGMVDRLLDAAKVDKEERVREAKMAESRKALREEKRRIEQDNRSFEKSLPTDSAFDEIYGDLVNVE